MISRLFSTSWAIGVAALLFAIGCGGTDGPERFKLSGNVTFEGKSVPVGFIKFSPDPSKGNAGPGTGAPITNGSYETSAGKGVVSGAHTVEISGWDGVPIIESGEELLEGKEVFPLYRTTVSIPKSDMKLDFAVPREDARKVEEPAPSN